MIFFCFVYYIHRKRPHLSLFTVILNTILTRFLFLLLILSVQKQQIRKKRLIRVANIVSFVPDTAKCFIYVVSLEANVLIAAKSDTWWQAVKILQDQSSLSLGVKASRSTYSALWLSLYCSTAYTRTLIIRKQLNFISSFFVVLHNYSILRKNIELCIQLLFLPS